MDSSSGSNIHHQPSFEMLPPRPIKRKLDDKQSRELSLFSSDASHTLEEPRSNFDQIHGSPTACASPQPIMNAMATKKIRENDKAGNDFPEHLDIDYVSSAENVSLRDIAADNVDIIFTKMGYLTNNSLENKARELVAILEGNDDSQKREYLMLQKLVQCRTDLTARTLTGARRLQLQILVAIKTGSSAFLRNSTSFLYSLTSLIEIFEQKKCRNANCQSPLPAKNCVCMTCTKRKGFCNLCMCVICNKYEFEMVTCPSSSNMLSHKIHMDCAMRSRQIGLSLDAPQSVENGEGGKLIAPQEASNQIAEVETKMEWAMPRSSEGTLVLEEEEEEHATPETEVIEGKTSGQTEVKAPNNPDGAQVEEVQPLEQLQQLVEADGAQPELATRDAGPSSLNSSSNLRPSTLLRKFPPIPPDLPLVNVSNMNFPNLSFHGTYSSSKDTVEATTPDQAPILTDFFRSHPIVQTHIESFSKVLQNTFKERLATLLHHLHFVRVRDFNEAARAEVQEAWTDLIRAGCELQDLEPAVNQALHAKEELTTKMLALQRDIQACRDKLDKPPVHNSDDHFL